VLSVPPEPASILALAALVLLPGLAIVRAPWTSVPALSLAFWVLTLWWPPFAAVSRGRFVGTALVAFALLASLRLLPKHEVLPDVPGAGESDGRRPPQGAETLRAAPSLVSGPSLLILTAALALLASFPLWCHAPGPEMAFQTTAARLLLWRDGLPLSGQPLLPLGSFGAHAPALPTLAADVSHLSGIEPAPAVLAVTLAFVGLLLIGLFALYATMTRPWAAALGALLGLALAPWPGFLVVWGEGGAIVGLALGISGAALLVGHSSRSSSVAASLLLGSSALGQPLLAAAIAAIAGAAALWRPVAQTASGVEAGERRASARGRLVLALSLALVLDVPYIVRLGHDLSAGAAASALASPTLSDMRALALGLVFIGSAFALGCRLVPLHPNVGRLVPLHPSEGGLVPLRTRPWGLVVLRPGVGGRDVAVFTLGVVSAVVFLVRVDAWIAGGQLPARMQAAIARASAATGPLDIVCGPEGARDWIPALAGRQAGEPGPWIPPVYREEWAQRPRRACAAHLEAFLDGQ